jgi:hypothetical protein
VLKTRLKNNGGSVPRLSKAQLAGKIAALQAQLEDHDDGVYKDPSTGRWFIGRGQDDHAPARP